jgi:hypothetical protein
MVNERDSGGYYIIKEPYALYWFRKFLGYLNNTVHKYGILSPKKCLSLCRILTG